MLLCLSSCIKSREWIAVTIVDVFVDVDDVKKVDIVDTCEEVETDTEHLSGDHHSEPDSTQRQQHSTRNTDLWLPPVLTDILLTAFLNTSYKHCLYTETFYYISFTGPENFETLKMLPLKAINIQQHFLWRHWAF